ncbi:MAG: ArgP/LysG family DNA-binding transcriptional regulator, partial [bacterium]|nr:ArgP/LysG family DNA-binding transcriptional regulator [bacterium]
MLDYKLIESLATVVREGGFEKAARVLFLTQSAVSQRVKLLEEQTGQVLLARSSPPRATAAGQKMVKHYLQVKRLEDDLSEAFVPSENKEFVSMSVGVNEDSLAFWFLDAVRPFLENERVVLDIWSDDQEQTHRLLRDGTVVGCVSSQDKTMQGCRTDYLGWMDYSLYATPEFAARWFPRGLNADSLRRAPALIFNRKDKLHAKLFQHAIGEFPDRIP